MKRGKELLASDAEGGNGLEVTDMREIVEVPDGLFGMGRARKQQ